MGSWADRYRLLRFDLEGFGRSPMTGETLSQAAGVAALLDELGIARAAFVACSMGGRVALELARRAARPGRRARPRRRRPARFRLVRGDGGLRRGGVRARRSPASSTRPTELNMRFWVDGPRRSPADVDPAMRAAMAAMQRPAHSSSRPRSTSPCDEELLVPDLGTRLGEIDRADARARGRGGRRGHPGGRAPRCAAEIPGARSATIPDTAHAPSLRAPGGVRPAWSSASSPTL